MKPSIQMDHLRKNSLQLKGYFVPVYLIFRQVYFIIDATSLLGQKTKVNDP
jgi:hypothetical protein